LEPKAPPYDPPEKQYFGWLVTAGLSKKRVDSTDASKLAPTVSALFFCALRAPGRRSRPGLPHCCVVALAEKRRCGSAAEITRVATRYTSSPPSAERTQFGIVMK